MVKWRDAFCSYRFQRKHHLTTSPPHLRIPILRPDVALGLAIAAATRRFDH